MKRTEMGTADGVNSRGEKRSNETRGVRKESRGALCVNNVVSGDGM